MARPIASAVKIVFRPSFFSDIFYRRIGWQRNLRPSFLNLPGGYELHLLCFSIFAQHRRQEF